MTTDRQVFSGNTAGVIFHSILELTPAPVRTLNPVLPAKLEEIISTALEKDRDLRCQSAAELRADLRRLKRDLQSARLAIAKSGRAEELGSPPGALEGTATEQPSQSLARKGAIAPASRWRAPRWMAVGVILGLLAGTAVGLFVGKRERQATLPLYHQLTFRRGVIRTARFAPDGQTIVYSAAWDGKSPDVFITRRESPESRSLGLSGTELLAISSTGEMAILLGSHVAGAFTITGTLGRASLVGGAAREVLEGVEWADWSPDGTKLAVVRNVGGQHRLEYPIDTALYETTGWISHPRVSPDGDRVAFLDHPLREDDMGAVAVVGLAGRKQVLTRVWSSVQGLAWSPRGNEIWFTTVGSLYAVSLSGHQRLLGQVPGFFTLQDVRRDGGVLLTHDDRKRGMIELAAGETKERDLSLFDISVPADLSADGKTLLCYVSGMAGYVSGMAGGNEYFVYLRQTDGAPAIHLGDGIALALSPDGKWALSTNQNSPTQLVLLPTGAGQSKLLPQDGITHLAARWFPDGKRLLLSGNEPGHGVRAYIGDLAGTKLQPITPEGVDPFQYAISPDGKLVAAIGPDHKGYLFPVEKGEPRSIQGLTSNDAPIAWSQDGRFLYIYRRGEPPADIYRLNPESGQKTLLEQLVPFDPAGVYLIGPVLLTPDAKTCVYNYRRVLSTLNLVEGLK